jgi:hypothetical protein
MQDYRPTPEATKLPAATPRRPTDGSSTTAGRTITASSRVVTQSPRSPAGEASSLPESLQRVIRTASVNPEQAARMTPKDALPMLRAEEARLLTKLSPAAPDAIKAILGKLSLHYSLGNATVPEVKQLIEDYMLDLSHLPAAAIQQAVTQYRRDPGSQFFPKVGVLLALANANVRSDRDSLTALRKLIAALEGVPVLEHQPQRPKPEDWAKLLGDLARIPDPPAAPPITLPVCDRTYFENRARKAQETPTTETDHAN